MPSDYENELLAMAQKQAKQTVGETDPFGQVLGGQEPQSLEDLVRQASGGGMMTRQASIAEAHQTSNQRIPEPPLEHLWESPGRGTPEDFGNQEFRADGNELADLFMTSEARAQADLTGEPVVMPFVQTDWRPPSDDFNIQFDNGELDVTAHTPNERARFRVDRPPPRVPFQPRTSNEADGRVVMTREGGNWRPESAASRFRRELPAEVPVRQATRQPVRQQHAQAEDRSHLPTVYDRVGASEDWIDLD